MSTSKEIFWSEGESSEFLSFVPGVDLDVKKQKMQTVLKKGPGTKKPSLQELSEPRVQSSHHPMNETTKGRSKTQSANSSYSMKSSKRVSLKDLCPEDKERVANLIRELAKAGEDKEASENLLNDERKKFTAQLLELKSDKERIELEQKAILTQFNDCQKLLVFYQKKIADEQKEVARDISRLLSESPTSRSNSSFQKKSSKFSPKSPHSGILDHDISVHEIEEELSTTRSGKGSSQYKLYDTAGDLGQSFKLPQQQTQSPQQTNLHPQHVKLGTREALKGDLDLESLPSFQFTADAIGQRGHLQTVSTSESTSEDATREIEIALKRRIKTLSPNGRRQALLKQKKKLEYEQAHLQKLLAEQEDILRFRQKELKRRHAEYAKTLGDFKRQGKFSDNFSEDIVLSQSSTDASSDFYQPSVDSTDITTSTSSPRKCAFKESPRNLTKSVFAEPSSCNDEFTRLPGFRQSSGSPYFTKSDRQASTMDPSTFQNLSSDGTFTPLQPDSLGFPISQTGHSSVGENSVNVSVTAGSYRKPLDCDECYEDSLSHLSLSEQNSSRPGPRRRQQENDQTRRFVVVGNRSLSRRSRDDTLTEEELLVSDFTSPRRSMHNTMNNISTLSELVSSVERNETLYSLKPDALSPRGRPNDVNISTTFDPEDSQLLEDIFFIN